jgi:hypothetical protein
MARAPRGGLDALAGSFNDYYARAQSFSLTDIYLSDGHIR